MRRLSLSVTAAGAELAGRLPWDHRHGQAAETVGAVWHEVDGLVLFLATGAAVRIIAPLLGDKHTDPAVVCVDEAGRFVVALTGGHHGANELARQVAALLGAQAVVTTATEAQGVPGLDQLAGLQATGDVAGVTTALLDGADVALVGGERWPLPAELARRLRAVEQTPVAGPAVVVSDSLVAGRPGLVVLTPPSLVVGVGLSTEATPAEAIRAVDTALAGADLAREAWAEVATIDRREGHPAVLALGRPIRSWPSAALARVDVPHPSTVVAAAVGTPSVAEAAALLAAGPGGRLVVGKTAGSASPGRPSTVTVAVARRRRGRGRLRVVGLGPGSADHRTPAAEAAIRGADLVIGFDGYVELCLDLLGPAQEVVRSPIGDEVGRAERALTEAEAGRSVALVCSGDAGVYGMASLVCERAGPEVDVEVVPGVTAALAAAAMLGAPLGHDHVAVSLSDLLTPWAAIERRLRAAAEADLVVSLYNPRSRGRDWQLGAALELLAQHRPHHCPVGVVHDAGRPGARAVVTTLDQLAVEEVGMTSLVVVGSSTSVIRHGRMVTPRGYPG